MMKHKLVAICTLIAFAVVPLRAQDGLIDTKTKSDKLDWELTDVSMKKTATSMIMWGILIPICTVVLLWTIPNLVPANTDTSTSTSSSSSTT